MPIYVYKCKECGITFERFQHFSEEPIRVCPECDAPVSRLIQPVGIIFKGSGFYVTDHKSNTSSLMPKSDSKGPEKESESAAGAKESADTATADSSNGDET